MSLRWKAEQLHWHKKWDKVLDQGTHPVPRWFAGGEFNTCYNAVDRHVAAEYAFDHAGKRLSLRRRQRGATEGHCLVQNEDQRDDEDVVDRQRLLHQVAGEELERRLATVKFLPQRGPEIQPMMFVEQVHEAVEDEDLDDDDDWDGDAWDDE